MVAVISPIIHPTVISGKLSKIDPYLLWNTVRNYRRSQTEGGQDSFCSAT